MKSMMPQALRNLQDFSVKFNNIPKDFWEPPEGLSRRMS